MLILTRRVGEKIMIGDDVSVLVMSIDGSQVRLGIDAPKEVSVDREEVRQNKEGNPNYYDDKEQRGNR